MTQPTDPTPSRIDKILGPTAGPYSGNVRAMLAILLVLAFCGLLGFATFEYIERGREVAHDFVVGGFGALIAAFNGVVFFYLGKRSGETS